MARIELTPEKPEFPAGGWHVEGMINERICATALYYLDSENITTTGLDFRMRMDRAQEKLSAAAGQDGYNWLERIYGANFREDSSLQYYGRVETHEGRLLAFPNTFQHRVAPFSLKDRTKPGHRSFIALWLVDPALRVVSTANVPPQQLEWWEEAVFGGSGGGSDDDKNNQKSITTNIGTMSEALERLAVAKKMSEGAGQQQQQKHAPLGGQLPVELYEMVRAESRFTSNLMTVEEAKEHRLRLMEERTPWTTNQDEAGDVGTFNFCEH